MEYVIETNQLTKKFGSKLAVNAVDMHVRKGDIYGLIGRNGAGKTTAMRMMLGIIRPTSGSMKLFGSEDLNTQRMRIGSLIEAPGLYKGCTAKENLKRFSILFGTNDQQIDEILHFVELDNVGKKKVGQYSLGMKQRLGIAVALLGDPELLILDEPINGLDPAGIKEIRDVIIDLNEKKGVSFIISSHLLDELGKIATRYGIINNGELIDEIDADELKDRCKHNLSVTVDNVNKAVELLKENKYLDSYDVKENTIVIYSHIDQSIEINRLLVKANIGVSELTFNSQGFEDYFIERLGK